MGNVFVVLVAIAPSHWLRAVGSFAALIETLSAATLASFLFSVFSHKHIDPPTAQSERLFSALMDNLPTFAWMKDIQGRYVYVNKRLERLPPYQNGWLGKTDADLWPEEVAADYRASDQRVVATREPLETMQSYLVQGEQRDVVVTKFPIFDNSGALVMVGGAGVDITEGKRTAVALRESEGRFAKAFHASAAAMIIARLEDGRILEVNESLLRLVGYRRDELIGRTTIETGLWTNPDERAKRIQPLREQGTVREVETTFRRRSGEIRYALSSIELIELDNERCTLGIITDITERRQAEMALRQSEARYRAIVEDQTELICRSLPDGTLTFVNDAYCRYFGKQPKELIGNAFLPLIPEQDVDAVKKHIASLTSLHSIEPLEHRVYNATGELRWQQWTSRVIADPEGGIREFQSVGRDITERKRAEEALREAELKYRAIFENAEDGIFQTTPDGKTLTANPALARMLGFDSPEDLISERTDIAQQEYVDPAKREEFKRLLNESDVLQRFEYEVYRKDGSRIWISESVRAVRNENGILLYYEGITKDITERKRAEEALQESEERFRQLSEAAFEAIILHDNGTILEVNQSFCRMYGYERAEVIGKSILDMTLPQFRELFRQKLRSGDTNPYESPVLRKDGTVFNAELAGKPINYRGRVVRVGAIRDITEQKRNERRQAAQYAVTRVLAESPTLHDAIPKLLRVICESLRWKMGEFWRVCDSTNLLRCVETWHVPALEATSFIEASRQTELAPGAGLPGRVWQSGQPAWIPDVMTDPGFSRAAIAAKVGLRCAVAFPILLGDHTLGVMLFFSRRSPEVDEDLLKIMSAIGSQIGQFTERKRAEQALLASERRYRDIFTLAPVGIYQSLRDGALITANNALAEMLGYESVDELLMVKLGRDVYLDGEERERLIREYEGRGHTFDSELQWKRRDGSPIWVQVSAHAISRENGEIKCFEGFVRNITDRKHAEEAQRDSEQRFRATFEQSTVGMAITDTDGNFLQVNTALCNYLGYSEAELLKLGVLDITRPQDRFSTKRRFREVRAGNRRSSDQEKGYLRKDGTIVWGQTKVVWLLRSDSKSSYSVAVIQDITERKLAQQALEKFSRRLIEVQETERQTIARELHDEIGQVLTALKIGLNSVKLDVPFGDTTSRLGDNIAIVDEAMRLVRDLSLDLHPALLDDLGLVAALRWHIDNYAQRTGIQAALRLDNFDDKKRLPRDFETTCFRVVQEALTNVARHAQTKKASVRLRFYGEYLHMTIKDKGRGFDPKALRKRDAAHVTLGLRGMHERARAMGGTLAIKSRPSAGTEIHLILPFRSQKNNHEK